MSDRALPSYRDEFPALASSVYMVSHSLGAMPKRTYDHLRAYADLWVNKGINAWEDWLPEVDRAAERIGRIINAPAGSMVMATNVSQIQATIASCLDYTPARNKVVFTACPSNSSSRNRREMPGTAAVLDHVSKLRLVRSPSDRAVAGSSRRAAGLAARACRHPWLYRA